MSKPYRNFQLHFNGTIHTHGVNGLYEQVAIQTVKFDSVAIKGKKPHELTSEDFNVDCDPERFPDDVNKEDFIKIALALAPTKACSFSMRKQVKAGK